jgi:DNA-binding MarR family transcriptional regulator
MLTKPSNPPPDWEPLTEGDRAFAGWWAGFTRAWIEGMQEHGHHPTLLQSRAFFSVASKQGLSVQEYADHLEISKSTMSRLLLDLGDRNRKGQRGVRLITSRPNPLNRRKLEYWLTPKGHALFEQLYLLDDKILRPLLKRHFPK